jgi:hypothetical protein
MFESQILNASLLLGLFWAATSSGRFQSPVLFRLSAVLLGCSVATPVLLTLLAGLAKSGSGLHSLSRFIQAAPPILTAVAAVVGLFSVAPMNYRP